MREYIALIMTLIALSISCTASSAAETTPSAQEAEDRALSAVLEHLGYLHFLARGDLRQLRGLVDTNLNGHLTRLRETRGAISNDDFRAAEIRTLNAVAVLWDEQPPFASAEWRPNETNASWWPTWQASHQKNLELLRWAKEQCAMRPELKCRASKTSAKSAEDDRK